MSRPGLVVKDFIATILALVAFAVTFPYFLWPRDYPWPLALLAATAIAALVYSVWRVVERLGGLLR